MRNEIKRDLLESFLEICNTFSNSVAESEIVRVVVPQREIGKISKFKENF